MNSDSTSGVQHGNAVGALLAPGTTLRHNYKHLKQAEAYLLFPKSQWYCKGKRQIRPIFRKMFKCAYSYVFMSSLFFLSYPLPLFLSLSPLLSIFITVCQKNCCLFFHCHHPHILPGSPKFCSLSWWKGQDFHVEKWFEKPCFQTKSWMEYSHPMHWENLSEIRKVTTYLGSQVASSALCNTSSVGSI